MTTLLTPLLTAWKRRLVGILIAVLMVGCGGESGVSGPPDGGGSKLRPGLTATVGVEPEASALAQTLGWTSGVPNAEVRIHRFGTDFAWETVLTDALGVARFPDAIAGRYRVAAYRPLTGSEVAQVGGAARAFGDGFIMDVGGSTEATLRLNPTQPGSLVISEVYATAPFVAEVNYDFHMFFELYNNSDQTIFLDGLIFGTTLGLPEIDATFTCAESEPLRNDPDGVWAHFLHRFPGSGGEHPLAPGGVAVVALDAVDHSMVDSRFPDLSGADFELFGSADVDNPDVPNLPEVGVEPFQLGHGLRFFIGRTLFLAKGVDISTLERFVLVGGSNLEFVKLPTQMLIDVVETGKNDALEEQRFDICGRLVHRNFDRLEGGFIMHGRDLTFSVQRLVIGTVNGRDILQDTNTSAVDLVRARFTPGSVR